MKKPSTALSNTTTFTCSSVSIAVMISLSRGSCFGPKIFTGGMSKVTRQYVGRRRSSRICSFVKVRSGRFMMFTPVVCLKGETRTCARVGFVSDRLAQRPERGAHFRAEQLGLFPGCEMSTLVEPVVVDQF